MDAAALDKPHILVVDDDTRLRELLKSFLSRNGFRVTAAADAREARERVGAIDFDLLVLDVMMPGESGLELTAALRKDRTVPILMLTAMGEARDRIAGLERGVDDYLAKPFEPRELLLRIASILRRAAAPPPAAAARPALADVVEIGAMRFDSRRGELLREGRRVKLTEVELALLRVFAADLGRTLSREEVQKLTGAASARTVDVQVVRLRRKIEPDPKFPRHLHTVRGQGYRLTGD